MAQQRLEDIRGWLVVLQAGIPQRRVDLAAVHILVERVARVRVAGSPGDMAQWPMQGRQVRMIVLADMARWYGRVPMDVRWMSIRVAEWMSITIWLVAGGLNMTVRVVDAWC